MKRSAVAITVEVSEDNRILITAPEDVGDGPSVVDVDPDQVDLLIQWLQEAKTAALAARDHPHA